MLALPVLYSIIGVLETVQTRTSVPDKRPVVTPYCFIQQITTSSPSLDWYRCICFATDPDIADHAATQDAALQPS